MDAIVACRRVCPREMLLEDLFRQDIRQHRQVSGRTNLCVVCYLPCSCGKSILSGEVAVIDLYMVKWCLIVDRRSGVQTTALGAQLVQYTEGGNAAASYLIARILSINDHCRCAQ